MHFGRPRNPSSAASPRPMPLTDFDTADIRYADAETALVMMGTVRRGPMKKAPEALVVMGAV